MRTGRLRAEVADHIKVIGGLAYSHTPMEIPDGTPPHEDIIISVMPDGDDDLQTDTKED